MLAGMLVLPGVQVALKRLSTQSRLGIVLSHIMYSTPAGVCRRRLNCFPPRHSSGWTLFLGIGGLVTAGRDGGQ